MQIDNPAEKWAKLRSAVQNIPCLLGKSGSSLIILWNIDLFLNVIRLMITMDRPVQSSHDSLQVMVHSYIDGC